MVVILRYLRSYEIWIYIILGAVALWQVLKFIQAWRELQAAGFGMERDNAQEHLNAAALWMTLFLFAALSEFVIVSFVVPTVPEAMPIPTPTLRPPMTPTVTRPPTTGNVLTVTPLPVEAQIEGSECISTTLDITNPEDGAEVSGVITLEGTANIPNMGFYKYEVARPGDPIWLTIQAGRETVQNGKLGDWDTRTIPAGEYILRLVVTDNEGNALAPCIIHVRVAAPQTTQQP